VQNGIEGWFVNGWVTPSDTPGYGIELDDAAGRHWRLPGTTWFDEV
jgi:hypothetical protein